MSRFNFAVVIMLVNGLAAFQTPAQGADEGVFLDPQTGNYRVRFLDDPDDPTTMVEEVFYPHTKIDPIVKSKIQNGNDDLIEYHYKIKNGKSAKQDISTVIIYVSSAKAVGQVAPANWSKSVEPNIGGAGDIVGWSSRVYKYGIGVVTDLKDPRWKEPAVLGIPPSGESLEFGFKSKDLPGIGTVRHRGAAPITMFSGEGPDPETPVGKAYSELRENDFVPRLAAIPKISNPAPFDAVAILTGIQKHAKDDLVGMKLVEPSFAAKLDQGLTSAIEAAKRGNTEALRSEVKKLRHLLKGFGEAEADSHAAAAKNKDDDKGPPEDQIKTKDWPHPIAKLAARVLDFDLHYVEKRVKGLLD